jgi:peptidoglycan/xylan/chitin deacetylase (PgdA/CDA1 family)
MTVLAALVAALPHPLRRLETREKVVALTFDDGPNPPYTDRVLEILRHHSARATFFLLGRNIQMHRSAAQKIVEAGHEIGNHSHWHSHLRFATVAKIQREIDETDELIRGLGYQGAIPFRAPFGEAFPGPAWALWWMKRDHYLFDVWPVPPDYRRADPQAIANGILRRVRPGSVILMHDGEGIRTEAVVALENVLQDLEKRGYRFTTVGELFTSKSALK